MIQASLIALMDEALAVADWEKKKGALEKKLLAPLIDPLLTSLDIHGLHRLHHRHRLAVRFALERLTLPQARALSGKLNQHRLPKATSATKDELISELLALADGGMSPAPAPVPPPKPPRAAKPKATSARRRRPAEMAAE